MSAAGAGFSTILCVQREAWEVAGRAKEAEGTRLVVRFTFLFEERDGRVGETGSRQRRDIWSDRASLGRRHIRTTAPCSTVGVGREEDEEEVRRKDDVQTGVGLRKRMASVA